MGKIARRMHEKLDFEKISSTEEKLQLLEIQRDTKGILEEIFKLHSYFDLAVIREELTKALTLENKTDASVVNAQLAVVAALKENIKGYPLVNKYWQRYWQMVGAKKIKNVEEQNKNMLAPESVAHTQKTIAVIKAVHGIS